MYFKNSGKSSTALQVALEVQVQVLKIIRNRMEGPKHHLTPLCLQNSASCSYIFLIDVVQSLYVSENIFYLLLEKKNYNPKTTLKKIASQKLIISLYEILFLFWLVSSPNLFLSSCIKEHNYLFPFHRTQ